MHTEITGNRVKAAGWIFFDAECRFCVAGRRRWGRVFERRGFTWLPLQTAGTAERLGVTPEQLMAEMWVLPVGSRPLNGVDAWIGLMRRVWWLMPLATLLALPGIKRIGQLVYRWIARNRYCIAGHCRVSAARRMGLRSNDTVLVAVIVAAVLVLGWNWPAWILMWTLAVTLGQSGKCLGWRDARETGYATPLGLSLVWFLFWPGLDGRSFFASDTKIPRPLGGEWFSAVVKLALGIALIWLCAPSVLAWNPLAAGWIAMVGIVLCLHLGIFHLLSVFWRSVGVNARPIMNRPLMATSLAAFWGERWNTAFSIPAARFIFKPLARRHGTNLASLAVFLASGLLHELVISLPARGGGGLPTGYFLLQGAAGLFERSATGHAIGLGQGWRGWLFTMLITTLPAFWLFHPPFIRNVILPMLHALGAT